MAKKGKPFKDLTGLGLRLKSLRQAKELTQKEAGMLMDVSEASVRAWECGRAEPPLSYIAHWIESGEADPYWLLFGDE
jgi:transcriptional regulator with XRE-family HTH domain